MYSVLWVVKSRYFQLYKTLFSHRIQISVYRIQLEYPYERMFILIAIASIFQTVFIFEIIFRYRYIILFSYRKKF